MINIELDLKDFFIRYSYEVCNSSFLIYADIFYGVDDSDFKESLKKFRSLMPFVSYVSGNDLFADIEKELDGSKVFFLRVCLNPVSDADGFKDEAKKKIVNFSKEYISEILLNSIDRYKSFKEKIFAGTVNKKVNTAFETLEKNLSDEVKLLLELKEGE